MKPHAIAAAFMVLTATAAHADVAGIQHHDVQKLFMEAPCKDVISVIDNPGANPGLLTDVPAADMPQILIDLGSTAMAFGFLMGFEVAHPGIRGQTKTILTRLREDCATDGTKTAMDLLNGYVAE